MTSDERPTAARVQISRDGRRLVHFGESTDGTLVTEDGERFVVLQDLATTPDSIVVVQNWFRELDEKIGH